ncbi:RHS repeat-associated core domain protein [Leptospira santarosai str. JET]|nr:RHS repeat-associated core domain protein [Leptospira santarosai str. JET]
MTGGGSVGGVPVTGMFFFHPDHLGSITMITDGAGNPASGPEPGTSFVSYEPYGSIIRNDSYGPDIFRYKFTGQIEDKETGLYYYKARYYEPTLGRFLQADSVIDSDAPNGQNRYMYVEGNPVNYRDPSGHSLDLMFYAALYQYAQIPNSPQKDNSNLMLLVLHNQQIRNTSGPGCPISGKNPLVFGNFQGDGMCGGKLPGHVELYMAVALSRSDLGPTLALAYYFLYKPNSALTIVDRSGIAHDENHSWKSTPKAIHANEDWIKQSWGNFYSINEQRAAYKREYDALPKSYDRYGGTGKSIIAGVNYAATTTFDYEALTLGTTIFAVQNIVGYTSRFVNHAMFVPKGRYNNLWNPKKWRL